MIKGHCLCGTTTYELNAPMAWRGHCHCESCRRNCSAAFATFFGAPRSSFRWTGQSTGTYTSSPGVRRHFCTTCGTPMAYDNDEDAANIHLYAASLDDNRNFSPDFHVFHEEIVPWITLGDHLKAYPKSGGVSD